MYATLAKNTNPINYLPVELLVRIFLLSEKQTHKSKPYPHLRLSWVCKYWRKIINRSPVFWTVIKFSPWKGQGFIRELISRSGSAELSVFSPGDSDISGHRSRRADEILCAFCELLEQDGHRIKFLSVTANRTDDENHEISNLLFGKVLPALKVFCCKAMTEPLALVQSAKHLQYLKISLFSIPSLSALQPSFHNLKALHITFRSFPITRQFYFTCLSLCSNLESLMVYTTDRNPEHILWDAFHLPSVITLPNLIFLCVDGYTFIDQLRAPALKTFVVTPMYGSSPLGVARHNYLIFDEYDLSSVTNLSICGLNIFPYETSHIWIRGSTGLIPWICPEVPMIQFETQDADLRGDILPFISSAEPTQFRMCARYVNDIGEAPKSSFLPKLLLRLRNLEALSINPYYLFNPFRNTNARDIETKFLNFFEEIFDNLVSVRPRWLIVTDKAGNLNLLRILFELINAYPSLSSLNRLTYRIEQNISKCSIGGHDFGIELVKFLRVRREESYDTLERFEMEGGECLPEGWIAEAANLGTHIHQIPSASDERIYDDFWC